MFVTTFKVQKHEINNILEIQQVSSCQKAIDKRKTRSKFACLQYIKYYKINFNYGNYEEVNIVFYIFNKIFVYT